MMRDAERFKDKIEVSLDGRQIFFLFFGGAVVASLVFVLGVMVGKRLEGRERVAMRARTTAAVDPLTALDELGAEEQADDLGFQTALGAGGAAADKAAEKAAEKAAAKAAAKADKPPEKPADKPDQPAEKPAEKAPPVLAAEVSAPAPAPLADGAQQDKEKVREDRAKPKKKGKFTLQLSSFQDRAEADAFVAKLGEIGMKPFIIQSDVPDKGTFFRVRVGELVAQDEALAAKGELEKREHIIAYVTKL